MDKRKWWIATLAFTVIYFLSGTLGLSLASLYESASPVWPPTGIAMAGLFWLGLRAWPAVFIGATAFNIQTSGDIDSSVVIGIGNTLEGIVGGWALRRAGGVAAFERIGPLTATLGTIIVATQISAGIGVLSLVLLSGVPAAAGGGIYLTWMLGDLGGALLLAPLLVHAQSWKRVDLRIAALSLAGAGIAFFLPSALAVLLLVATLSVAAIQADRIDAFVGMFLTGTIAILAIITGRGPFSGRTVNESLLLLQVFLVLSIIVVSVLAAGRKQAGTPAKPDVATSLSVTSLSLLPLILATVLIGAFVHPTLTDLEDQRYRDDALSLQNSWEQSIGRDAERLFGLSALYASSDEVSRAAFEEYVNSSRWLETVTGVRGVAFVQPVLSENVGEYERQVRQDQDLPSELRANFSVYPSSDNSVRFVVHTIAPLEGNQAALGLDLGFNESRREALQQAEQTGNAIITAPIRLVQADNEHWGVLHIAAVYQNDELIGFVDTVRLIGDAATAIGTEPTTYRLVDVASDIVMFGDENATATFTQEFEIGGRLWEIELLEGTPLTGPEAAAPWFFLLSSGLVSVAISAVSYSYASTRERAQSMAGRLVKADRALEDVNHMKRMDDFRRQFLNNAAHELRTPMTPIRMQVEALIRGASTPAEKKAAGILDRSIKRLDLILQDLLDAARIDAGRLIMNRQSTDIAKLLQQGVEAYQEVAEKAGTQLTLEVGSGCTAEIDPDRISQVFDNLLGNALKFAAGGKVLVELGKTADTFRITVTDNGLGFDQVLARQLMQPFAQIHDEKKIQQKGTGLGLFLSKNIVELHGGRLELVSPGLGKGAIASVTLPLQEQDPDTRRGRPANEKKAAALND